MDDLTSAPPFRDGLRVMRFSNALTGETGWRVDALNPDHGKNVEAGTCLRVGVDMAGELDDEVLARALKALNDKAAGWSVGPFTVEQVRERAAEVMA